VVWLVHRPCFIDRKLSAGDDLPHAKIGIEGVDLSWPGMRGAKSFVVQIATVPEPVEADWKLALVSTKSRCTVGGLTTDERYWFRVAAVGAAGQSPWSPTATGKAS